MYNFLCNILSHAIVPRDVHIHVLSIFLVPGVADGITYSLSLFHQSTCIRFVPRGPGNYGANYITFKTDFFLPM